MSSPDLTPIEQAAADALARETGAHTPMTLRYLARVMVAAVEPLIRAQVLAEVLPLIRDLTDPHSAGLPPPGGWPIEDTA